MKNNKPKHTPGPWKVVGKSKGDGIVCFVGSLEVVTTTNRDPLKHPAEADANLIAAAPEMLEALEVLLLYTRSCEILWNHQESNPCKIAAKAIAEARGEEG